MSAPRSPSILETAATAAIALAGLVLSAAKAASASMTPDEAWNYNEWVSRGFASIWTDYHAVSRSPGS